MNRYIFGLAIAGLLLAVTPVAGYADGRKIFVEKNCNSCHAVTSAGIAKEVSKTGKTKKGPDLSGTGLDYDAATIAEFLQKKKAHPSVYGAGKKVKHKKKFKGSDAELKAVAEFLAVQKTKVDKAAAEAGAEDDAGDE